MSKIGFYTGRIADKDNSGSVEYFYSTQQRSIPSGEVDPEFIAVSTNFKEAPDFSRPFFYYALNLFSKYTGYAVSYAVDQSSAELKIQSVDSFGQSSETIGVLLSNNDPIADGYLAIKIDNQNEHTIGNGAFFKDTNGQIDRMGLVSAMHEVGHFFGLDHPANYQSTKVSESVMGYGWLPTVFKPHNPATDYASTYSPRDILSLQALYGLPNAYQSDDVYMITESMTVQTIFDTGGYDVLDARLATVGFNMNLTPGYSGGFNIKQLGIAYSRDDVIEERSYLPASKGVIGSAETQIESISGSMYADSLRGNFWENTLAGMDGNDTIVGTGNDFISGGLNDDTIIGQSGDFADYTNTTDHKFLSGRAAQIIYDGNAKISHGIKVDMTRTSYQVYDDGTSTSNGSLSKDNIIGLTGIIGTSYSDYFKLSNSPSGMKIFSGAGKDTIIIGSSFDAIDGGSDSDTASWEYLPSNIGIEINLSTGITGAGAAENQVTSIENVTGGAGDDKITGNSDNNTLIGGGGNNILDGSGGDDNLSSGSGINRFIGGAGKNTISAGQGTDTIVGGEGSDFVLMWYYNKNGIDVDYSDSPAAISLNYNMEYYGKIIGSGGYAQGDVFSGLYNNYERLNVKGTAFNDNFGLFPARAVLYGFGGNDVMKGSAEGDYLDGGANDDNIAGGGGADTILGGSGYDWLNAGADKDIDILDFGLDGGGLDFTSSHVNNWYWGYGITLDMTAKTYQDKNGNGANDIIIGSFDAVRATPYDDIILGSSANDKIYGIGGADKIEGMGGDDFIEVSSSLTYNTWTTSLNKSGEAHGGDGIDTIRALMGGEFIFGDGNDDILLGYGVNLDGTLPISTYVPLQNATHLYGGDGRDKMYGGYAKEVFHSLMDGDTVIGGGRNDTLTFEEIDHGINYNATTGTGTGISATGISIVIGTPSDDTFTGGYQINVYGGGGVDTFNAVYGGSSYGGSGNDIFTTVSGSSNYGEDDNDIFTGSGHMNGGGGKNSYYAYDKAGVDMSGTGSDTLYFRSGQVSVSGWTKTGDNADHIVLPLEWLHRSGVDSNNAPLADYTPDEWFALPGKVRYDGYYKIATVENAGNKLVITGIEQNSLHGYDFLFA